MQNKLFLKAADICELLEVKQTSAYEIIGNLNKELEEQGYLTLSSVLVLCRWTALRDIPTTAPISPSVSSRTQCSIKMLCPGWGKLAKAAATSPLLI